MESSAGTPASSSEVSSSPPFDPNLTPPPESPSEPLSQTHSDGRPPLHPSGSKKLAKERYDVWEHYEKYDDVTEIVNPDGTKTVITKKRARCIYCKVAHYAADTNLNGTTNLGKHTSKCKAYPGRVPDTDQNQKTLSFHSGSKSLTARAFSKDECSKALVEMIVLDELPFKFVEGVGFRKFCSVACPLFQVPSRRTIVRQFLGMYEDMKDKLKEELAPHRVSLTTDTWTSVQNINYMVITAHFIDFDWKFHKRVLNFCVIANHKGNSIGKLLEACLLDWGLEKILTISSDNASSNTVAIEYLKGKMAHWTNSNMVLNGKYMHVRCCAHIVNLIVGDGLKRLENSIASIRNAVKYVRSSPQRLEYFKKCVLNEKSECKGLVVLDVPTRWNSTYTMLEAALRFAKAFRRMGEDEESAYLTWFGEHESIVEEEIDDGVRHKRRNGPPSVEDWKNVEVFIEFLKVFYDMTLKMSFTLRPVVHETFHDLVAIDGEIKDLLVDEEMIIFDEVPREVLKEMATSMMKNFEKYWGDLDKVNHFLFVALVLDPRYKLGNLFHLLKKICGSEVAAVRKRNEVKDILIKLHEEYVGPSTRESHFASDSNASRGSSSGECVQGRVGKRRRVMDEDWFAASQASATVILEHEVDRYLADPLEHVFGPFDILSWWNLNGVKYPGLTKIAKDVLAIPVSTVASESCFSTGGRVVSSYRASLTPKVVEALICTQNWLRSDTIDALLYEPTIEEIEFYEEIESEMRTKAASATITSTAGRKKLK